MAFDIDIAAEVENPIVRALDLTMFDQQDLVNLILLFLLMDPF